MIFKYDSCGLVSGMKSGFTHHKCTQKPNVNVQSEPGLLKCGRSLSVSSGFEETQVIDSYDKYNYK